MTTNQNNEFIFRIAMLYYLQCLVINKKNQKTQKETVMNDPCIGKKK